MDGLDMSQVQGFRKSLNNKSTDLALYKLLDVLLFINISNDEFILCSDFYVYWRLKMFRLGEYFRNSE